MNHDEQALIDFALLWQPFGGPPSEDILTAFGITESQFRARVRHILITRGTRTDEPFRQHARAVLRTYTQPHTHTPRPH
ncbi:hypothetical protein ACQP0C_23645 [Nocardia sp. CA-129566]|uniref:hypothetical protein n=1 Tax=Nocardia sp. CA-129566 TaxID=3239976 RepID=UPI003D9533A3